MNELGVIHQVGIAKHGEKRRDRRDAGHGGKCHDDGQQLRTRHQASLLRRQHRPNLSQ